MGSTEYYQAVLRADELAGHVQAAMDFPEFASFTESERMQRPMNEGRVEREIVPYLCMSPDRFFGSLIVLVYKPKLFKFTAFSSIGLRTTKAIYAENAERSGVLEISGGQLFALDGQHRLHALRVATSDADLTPRLGLRIQGAFRRAIVNDELSVIFLTYQSKEAARRIFNKVNRYAKPTSESINILTSEDDGYWIVTRCLLGLDDAKHFGSFAPPPLDLWIKDDGRGLERAVDLERQQLDVKSSKLTTLSVVSRSVQAFCEAAGLPTLSETQVVVRPSNELLSKAYEVCAMWWRELTLSFVPFSSFRDDPSFIRIARHADHDFSLAFRPKSQEALIAALAEAHALTGLSPRALVAKLNRLNMKLSSEPWLGILVGSNGKMILKHFEIAKDIIVHFLLGKEAFGSERERHLLARYHDALAAAGYR